MLALLALCTLTLTFSTYESAPPSTTQDARARYPADFPWTPLLLPTQTLVTPPLPAPSTPSSHALCGPVSFCPGRIQILIARILATLIASTRTTCRFAYRRRMLAEQVNPPVTLDAGADDVVASNSNSAKISIAVRAQRALLASPYPTTAHAHLGTAAPRCPNSDMPPTCASAPLGGGGYGASGRGEAEGDHLFSNVLVRATRVFDPVFRRRRLRAIVDARVTL